MANTIYNLQISAAGGNPVVSGDKRRTLRNFIRLLLAILNSNRPRSSALTVVAEHTGVQASAVVTCAAVQAGDTVTVNGQALTATQHNATGTATFSTIVAGNVVTLNGVAFTAATAAATATEFTIGASDTTAAAALAAAVNAYSGALITGIVTATSAAGVVTFRAVTGGAGGNSITLTKTGSPISVSAATLTNGATVANNQFDYVGSNTQTAAALAAALAASTTDIVSRHVSGSNVAGACTISALTAGHSGNAITIATSNGTRLAITGSVSRLASGSSTRTSFTF